MSTMSLKVAADIGGTFTDIALFLPDGRLATRKVPSTPRDYSIGVVDGMRSLVSELGLQPSDFAQIHHGCTVATNAILEQKGARTALLTTRGFRDVLELRRIRVPRLYDPLYVKPAPLAARNHRYEVTERMDADGRVLVDLDENDVMDAVASIRRDGVEAVAVCFLHSYKNPAHERRVGEILRRELPDRFVTLSVDVLPEIREYERTSTAVINAYVGPPVATYIGRLRDGLDRAGFTGQLMVMQSSGGTLEAQAVIDFPARIVECGPAAGVIGAAHEAAQGGQGNVITFDMGGTTAKASLIEDGQITRTDEYEVGGGISLSSRLLKGGGYALKLPVIDISEVGAGGGSIIRVDGAGAVKVGPDSAGAVPGPVCYGAGGSRPTVTDANMVLGYLNPTALAGGTVSVDRALAEAALVRDVAQPLGMSVEEAAWSVYVVAAANMVRAVKAVSTYRGRNPSDFVLMAFGGNGGIFAAELMRHLQMKRAIVPAAAGVFSAVGLCVGEVQFSQSRSFLKKTHQVDRGELNAVLDDLEQGVRGRLGNQNRSLTRRRSAAMRYVGQAFELSVPLPDRAMDAVSLAEASERFEAEHERTYGLRLDGFATEIVSLDVTVSIEGSALPQPAPGNAAGRQISDRRAYFGPEAGWLATPVVERGHLARGSLPGPLIVEEYEGTTVVPPGAFASLDGRGNIIIDMEAA